MSFILLLILFILGTICIWIEINSKKTPKLLLAIFLILFVITVLSRIDNYPSYADLGSYLSRFKYDDNAYFGFGYVFFVDAIKDLFGKSSTIYLVAISSFNLIVILISALLLSHKNGDSNETKPIIENRYIASFVVLYSMYWGLSFSAEVIRSGLAITTSLLAVALLLRKKTFLAIIVYFISFSFHWSQIFLLPILLIFRFNRLYSPIKQPVFLIWLVLLLFLDFINISSLTIEFTNQFLIWVLSKMSLLSHYSGYVNVFERVGILDYITRQYLFYRVTGFLLIFGNLKHKIFNKSVFAYFVGLTVFTFLNALEAVTRMSWVFLPFSIYALYFFISKNKKYNTSLKGIIVTIYLLLQTIMAFLYLG